MKKRPLFQEARVQYVIVSHPLIYLIILTNNIQMKRLLTIRLVIIIY